MPAFKIKKSTHQSLSRRLFSKYLLSLPASHFLTLDALAREQYAIDGVLYASGVSTRSPTGHFQSSLSIFDIKKKKSKLFEFGYPVHAVMVDKSFNHLYGTAKEVSTIKVVDLTKNEIIKEINLKKNHHFCGHGLVDLERKVIYLGEMESKSKHGFISIYELGSFKKLGEFDSGGFYPHEMILSQDKRQLIVSNSYGPSEVSFLEIKSGKKNGSFPSLTAGVMLRHLHRVDDNQLVIGTSLNPDLTKSTMREPRIVSMLESSGEMVEILPNKSGKFNLERHHISESLSVSIDSKRKRYAVTFPFNNYVVFVNFYSKEIANVCALDFPVGISLTPDNRYYIVSCRTQKSSLRFIDADTLVEVHQMAIDQDYVHDVHGTII